MPPVRKFALLPTDLQQQLRELFVANGFGNIEAITEELNGWCQKEGIPLSFGKSSVGEEALRFKRAQETIAAVTLQMQAVADSSGDSAAKRAESLTAAVSTELFSALIDARTAEATADPEARIALMGKAALAAARLTAASVTQQTFRAEVEKRSQVAAEKVAKLARKGGADAKTIADIKTLILGIPKARAAEPT